MYVRAISNKIRSLSPEYFAESDIFRVVAFLTFDAIRLLWKRESVREKGSGGCERETLRDRE